MVSHCGFIVCMYVPVGNAHVCVHMEARPTWMLFLWSCLGGISFLVSTLGFYVGAGARTQLLVLVQQALTK